MEAVSLCSIGKPIFNNQFLTIFNNCRMELLCTRILIVATMIPDNIKKSSKWSWQILWAGTYFTSFFLGTRKLKRAIRLCIQIMKARNPVFLLASTTFLPFTDSLKELKHCVVTLKNISNFLYTFLVDWLFGMGDWCNLKWSQPYFHMDQHRC